MKKLAALILILSLTAACGGGDDGGGRRSGNATPTPTPTPTATPIGGALHVTPGYVESSATMAMKASIGNTRFVTSSSYGAAVISVGLPSMTQ